MVLCSFAWQLDWHREEKEATARKTASGQSAEGQTTHSRAERKGSASPAQSPSLEGESGGPAASGRQWAAPSPHGLPALYAAAGGVQGGERPSSSPTEVLASKRHLWPQGRPAGGPEGAHQPCQASAQARAGRLRLCSAHPNPEPSASAAALLGPRACRRQCRAQGVQGSAASTLGAPACPSTSTTSLKKRAVPWERPRGQTPGCGGGKESSGTLLGRIRKGGGAMLPSHGTRWVGGQHSPVLERGGGGGLAEPAAGTDSDLYRAVSRRSLKRSAAMSALDSSCRGMLLMSEEKGLSGFSRLISQLVFPGEGQAAPLRPQAQCI